MESFLAMFGGTESVGFTLFVIMFVCMAGLQLGKLRVGGVSLGIAGALFAGLAAAQIGFKIDTHILHFVKEFGLVLFVYAVGLQVGPGFFSSLRKDGLTLNLAATAVVLLGVCVTLFLVKVLNLHPAVAVGLLAGATTNTPSLASAQQAMEGLSSVVGDPSLLKLPTVGYATAYPFGVIGIILTFLGLRALFKHSANQRAQQSTPAQGGLTSLDLVVRNSNLEGLKLADVPEMELDTIKVSRVMHNNEIDLAHPGTILHKGDVFHAVGKQKDLAKLKLVVGEESEVNLVSVPSELCFKSILVTKASVSGKRLEQLPLCPSIVVTRVTRGPVEFTPNEKYRLQLGDALRAVGRESALQSLEKHLGNSVNQLTHPHLIPVFLGIGLGVLVGSFPMSFPGVPTSLKLGLAGGPLVVALLQAHLANRGFTTCYLHPGANQLLKELGITLFLASIGLYAGDAFLTTLLSGDGLLWIFYGALITLIPIALVGSFMKWKEKLSFPALFGLLSGSMTDPPALAFANSLSESDAPAQAYATVFPFVMMMRVISTQLLVLLLLS